MYFPVISEVTAYEVCGVGEYAASNTTPLSARRSRFGVVFRP
jgi:hypothetical protein